MDYALVVSGIGGIASLMAIRARFRGALDDRADQRIGVCLDLGPISSAEVKGRTNLWLMTIERRFRAMRQGGLVQSVVKPHPQTGEVRTLWFRKFPAR
jgi:hypothetical protein